LVSVVIPTLNYGTFLGRALASVAAQTYAPIEVIVVDNGSTDTTNEVLAAHARAITVLRQPIRGPSAARNMGIRAARGRYIALLDADDRWRPEKLTRQVALLERNPGLAAVGCGVQFITADGAPLGHRDVPARASEPIDLAVQLRRLAVRDFGIGGSASGAVIRRDAFDVVGWWDETLLSAEDWDMWMRLAATFPIGNVTERLVEIALHTNGSWRDPATRERNQWRALNAALARWPDALGQITNRLRAQILADVGGEYVAMGNPRLALRRYLQALWHWPLGVGRWRAVASLALSRAGLRTPRRTA
jgi:glycosyltransferase involved in cell wall biosynthesis